MTVKQCRIKSEDKKDYKKLEKILEDNNIPYRYKGDKKDKPIYIRTVDHSKLIDLVVLFPVPSRFNIKEKEIMYEDSVEYLYDLPYHSEMEGTTAEQETAAEQETEDGRMLSPDPYDYDDSDMGLKEGFAFSSGASETVYPDDMSDTDRRILEKLDRHEDLTEKELKYLVYECEIDSIEGEDGRWTRSVTTIAKLGGRTFSIDWERGLTEMQESEFYDQPVEVFKHEHEETVTVTDWLPVSMRTEMAPETKLSEMKEATDALRKEIDAMKEKDEMEEFDTDPEEDYDEDLVY